jgi:signal peptidase II
VSIRARSASVLFATAAFVWVVDRASKAWVEATLSGRPPVTVIPGVLDLRFTTNSGGAFSLGRSTPWLFVAGTVVVACAIVVTAFRHEHLLTAVALGLILGGALGNLTDRATRGPHLTGHVIDFIDVHVWPIFNVADSAVVVGAILLAISSVTAERRDFAAPDAG